MISHAFRPAELGEAVRGPQSPDLVLSSRGDQRRNSSAQQTGPKLYVLSLYASTLRLVPPERDR